MHLRGTRSKPLRRGQAAVETRPKALHQLRCGTNHQNWLKLADVFCPVFKVREGRNRSLNSACFLVAFRTLLKTRLLRLILHSIGQHGGNKADLKITSAQGVVIWPEFSSDDSFLQSLHRVCA